MKFATKIVLDVFQNDWESFIPYVTRVPVNIFSVDEQY